jgi:hypothetical protein
VPASRCGHGPVANPNGAPVGVNVTSNPFESSTTICGTPSHGFPCTISRRTITAPLSQVNSRSQSWRHPVTETTGSAAARSTSNRRSETGSSSSTVQVQRVQSSDGGMQSPAKRRSDLAAKRPHLADRRDSDPVVCYEAARAHSTEASWRPYLRSAGMARRALSKTDAPSAAKLSRFSLPRSSRTTESRPEAIGLKPSRT